MRALILHERAGPEGLVEEETPIPPIGIGDALVRVHAASFTPTELEWPSTWVNREGKDRTPVIPGHEVSGVVTELGYGTTGVAVGDAVYGLTDWYRDGTAAEYVAVEARNLAPMPASLNHVESAAVPLAALTAWQGLFDHGHLGAGQTALIHGAGGGVGTFAVQLARAADASVVATGRAWAREPATELGADRFVDIDRERFEDATGEVDLVFDLVGGEVLERSWSVIKPNGVVVSVVEQPPSRADRPPGSRSVFFVVEANRPELVELGRKIDAGDLRPIVGEVLPLARGRDAFEAKRNHGIRGKIVLQIA
jgi:NADPH:quinone reductase-like Zn-dependent oxidoreductase